MTRTPGYTHTSLRPSDTIDLQARGIQVVVHRAAKARAAAEGLALRAVIEAALRAYASGAWTPAAKGD